MEISLGVSILVAVSLATISVECRHESQSGAPCASPVSETHGRSEMERPGNTQYEPSVAQPVRQFLDAERQHPGRGSITTTEATTTDATTTNIVAIDVEESKVTHDVRTTTDVSLVYNEPCADSECSTEVVSTPEPIDVNFRYSGYPNRKGPTPLRTQSNNANDEDKVNQNHRPSQSDNILGGSQASLQISGSTLGSVQISSTPTQSSVGYSLTVNEYQSSFVNYTGCLTGAQTIWPDGHNGQGSKHNFMPQTDSSGSSSQFSESKPFAANLKPGGDGAKPANVDMGVGSAGSKPSYAQVAAGAKPAGGQTYTKVRRHYHSTSKTMGTTTVAAPTKPITPTEPVTEEQDIIPKYIPRPPNCGVFDDTFFTRIAGGASAPAAEKWPWMVAYGYVNSGYSRENVQWSCGGALVTPKCSITAAHCLEFPTMELKYARFGDLNLDDNDGASPVQKEVYLGITHPEYSKREYINDIAIVVLKSRVEFTDKIKPICLPFGQNLKNETFDGMSPYIAGWGTLGFHAGDNALLHDAQVPVVSNAECNKIYTQRLNKNIINTHICAGGVGSDSCQGDSGGPLMVPWDQHFYTIGLVSFGFKCGEIGFPGVYTRVTSYLPWIQEKLDMYR